MKFYKNFSTKFLFLVFLSVVFFVSIPANSVEALTFPDQECASTGMGPLHCTSDIYLNKYTYSPGESIVATFYIGQTDSWYLGGYVGAPSYVTFDGVSGTSGCLNSINCIRSQTLGNVLQASSSTGCHVVPVFYKWINGAYTGPDYSYTANLQYEVGAGTCTGGSTSGSGGNSSPYPAPIVTFNASTPIYLGSPTNLTWNATQAKLCDVYKVGGNPYYNHLYSGLSGNTFHTPTSLGTHIYEITCENNNDPSSGGGSAFLHQNYKFLADSNTYFQKLKEFLSPLIPKVVADVVNPGGYEYSYTTVTRTVEALPAIPPPTFSLKENATNSLGPLFGQPGASSEKYLRVDGTNASAIGSTCTVLKDGSNLVNNVPAHQFLNPFTYVDTTYFWTDLEANIGSHVYTLSCVNSGGGDSDAMDVQIQAPDLIASQPTQTSAVATIPKTYTSTVTNQGNTSTTSFYNVFQAANGSQGVSPLTPVLASPNQTGPLNGNGGNASVSYTHTFSTTGVKSVRFCADSNTSGVGTITESDELNNCSAWVDVTVTPAPAPDLTATPPPENTATVGQSKTFTSNIVNGGTASTGVQFSNIFRVANGSLGGTNYIEYPTIPRPSPNPTDPLTAGQQVAVSASYTFPAGSQGVRSVQFCADKNTSAVPESNEGNNCSMWTDVTVTVDQYLLTVNKEGNGTGIVISNDGGIDCRNPETTSGCTELYNDGTSVALTAIVSETTPTTIFAGWAGDCTGLASTCTVTVDRARNVTARFIVVPSGFLSASDCYISVGNSTCNSSVSWQTFNPIPTITSSVTSNYPVANSHVGSGNTGSTSYTIPYTEFLPTSFFLYHYSIQLATASARARCVAGTAWDGTRCTTVPAPAPDLRVTTWENWSGNGRDTVWNGYDKVDGPVESYAQANYALSWGNVTDATTCTLDGVSVSTSSTTVNTYNATTSTKTHTLSCTGPGGTNTDSVTITIPPVPLTFTKTCNVAGDQVTFNWTLAPGYTGGYLRPLPTFYFDLTTGFSKTVVITPDHTYDGVFLQTRASNDAWSDALLLGSFSCSSPTFPDLTASNPTQTTATMNTPVTFTSTISNIGTASTGNSFKNYFQRSLDGATVNANWLSTPNPMSALTAGANSTASYTFTFTGSGVRYVRACADISDTTLMTGDISESNEGNNCSAWVQVNVVPIAPTGLTATPSTCGTGTINLSWTAVSGATNYTLQDNGVTIYSGAATTYSHIGLSAGSSHSYTVRAENAAGNSVYSSAVPATAPSTCPLPDLTADAPTQSTATIDVSQTFTSTIRNIGTASTGASFYNSMQVATGPNGLGAIFPLFTTSPSPMPTLIVGATATATGSYTFTGATGIRSVRFCADNNVNMIGGIPESDDSNNCSPWKNITVVAEMSGNITASDCNIPAGGTTCNSTLVWSTTNPVATSAVTTPTNITVASGNSGTTTYPIAPPTGLATRTFYLYNNNVLLNQATASALCVAGTIWNGGACKYTVTGAALANGTISPTTQYISSGTATLTITPDVGYTASATGCGGTLSGTTYTTAPITANCTVTATFTAIAMSGTLTVPNCTIAAGGSSCTSTASWSTTNPIGTSAVTSSYPAPNTIVFTGNNGISQSVNIPYDTRDFYLYNNNVLLAQAHPTALCVAGTIWNGGACKYTVTGAALANGTISPTTQYISSGTATLTITPDVGYTASATGCGGTLSGTTYTTAPITANCTVTATFTAIATMSGDLSPVDPTADAACTIPAGSHGCFVWFVWSVTNPVGPTTEITAIGMPNYVSPSVSGGGPMKFSVPYNDSDPDHSRLFWLYNNAVPLDSHWAKASCVAGTTWNGAMCATDPMLGSITASNCLIPLGGATCDSTITWSTTNPVATSAVTTDPGVTIATGNSGTTEYSVSTGPGSRIFFLYNNAVELAQATASAACVSGVWDEALKQCVDNAGGGVDGVDLLAIGINPTVVQIDASYKFSTMIMNQGKEAAKKEFPNLLQMADWKESGGKGGGAVGGTVPASDEMVNIEDVSVDPLDGLGAGEKIELIFSKPLSFGTVGTKYFRACADQAWKNEPGPIDEGAENEKNNCTEWIPVVIFDTSIDGDCGSPQVHYNCAPPQTSINQNDSGEGGWYTWTCPGIPNPTNPAHCSEQHLVTPPGGGTGGKTKFIEL